MNLATGAEVVRWVADRLGMERGFGPCDGVGLVRDGQIVGGVVYTNFNPEAGVIEMTAYADDPSWMNRQMLGVIFDIPFIENRCQLLVWRVSVRNTHVARLAERLGFKAHLIPRLRGRDEDEIIFTLTDDDWKSGRFSRGRNGQVSASNP